MSWLLLGLPIASDKGYYQTLISKKGLMKKLLLGTSGKHSLEEVSAPALVMSSGANAKFAWEEFIYGEISNAHTRRAYGKAVSDLLKDADLAGLPLAGISPKFIRMYFDKMPGSIPTKKLRLSAVRRFFDIAVTRHAVPLNPALSVRGERYQVAEGKTPEITPAQAARLLKSCNDSTLIGLRDKTIIAVFIYTAARVGAISALTVNDFSSTSGSLYTLKFKEKGGKNREIPVRHDLEDLMKCYLEKSGLIAKSSPLFPSAIGKTGAFSTSPMHPNDVRRMLKRRLKKAGLSSDFSPHSFRVCTLTDLLSQEVPREDVQYLAGHADARTTALYDRRNKKITRNIVERISVKLS